VLAYLPATHAGRGAPSGGGGGALALDCGGGNCPATNTTSGLTALITLSTTNTSGVAVLCHVGTNGVPTAVTSAHLTWAYRTNTSSGGTSISEWTAPFSSALSSEVITATFAGAQTFVELNAYGIANAATSSYFDSNGSLPALGSGDTASVSTSNANDFISACYNSNTANPAASSSLTLVPGSGNNYTLSGYVIVSATQSALPVGTTVTEGVAGIGDAIIK
jgi:hypothetical protein